jgi:hypothetical protein
LSTPSPAGSILLFFLEGGFFKDAAMFVFEPNLLLTLPYLKEGAPVLVNFGRLNGFFRD